MFEKLVENWLDSAGERTYQPAFCQMLLARGHTVLHSTRHSPIEFGKDVIAIDPDGALCAYQLKGNPGSRLTGRQVREVQQQLIQLVSQPIKFPGLHGKYHKSYLVTNGEIDEEAQRAILEIGDGLRNIGYKYPDIEVISRGQLLAWAGSIGPMLWPSELEDVNVMLQLLVYDGRMFFPIEKLHRLLEPILKLDGSNATGPTATELRRRLSSAALLIGVCLKAFALKNNWYANVIAWTIFSVYSIAACEKWGLSYKRNASPYVRLAKTAIFDNLCELCMEMKDRPYLVEGNAWADTPFYPARKLLLSSLMALLWFWSQEDGWPNQDLKDFVPSFLMSNVKPERGSLWGEGAIPQWLICLWYLQATDATPKPDALLAVLLEAVCKRNTSNQALANPYYTLEDVTRHELREFLCIRDDPLAQETASHLSYSAEGLFHLLARTGFKQRCKEVWPAYSRLLSLWFEPKYRWQYCLWRSKDGTERSRQLPLRQTWGKLCLEARDVKGEGIPRPLLDDKFLLALWTIILPYRATPSAIRYLGWRFNERWFLDPAIQ